MTLRCPVALNVFPFLPFPQSTPFSSSDSTPSTCRSSSTTRPVPPSSRPTRHQTSSTQASTIRRQTRRSSSCLSEYHVNLNGEKERPWTSSKRTHSRLALLPPPRPFALTVLHSSSSYRNATADGPTPGAATHPSKASVREGPPPHTLTDTFRFPPSP
ncbi:hypothetical protein BJY59DRAFT_729162 [Rhodotorula toruloides]